MSSSDQPWLLPYENPLLKRLGQDFFGRIPRTPGVYLMLGPHQDILYVGKAKNLRARLNSYKRARPQQVSRKVIRMLNRVREIRWEDCPTEEAALLRENHLLREHRPPFNVVNTSPEGYYLIDLDFTPGEGGDETAPAVRFHLTTQPDHSGSQHRFGAFKGRGSILRGYAALLRLLWLSQADAMDRFEYPAQLMRRNPPSSYVHLLRDGDGDWPMLIRKYLLGTSRQLLVRLTAKFLEKEGIHPFYYRCIQDDLEAVQNFFLNGPRRNRRLGRFHRLRDPFIEQDRIDDLLVSYRLRRQERKARRHGT